MTHCDKRSFDILEDLKSFLCAQIQASSTQKEQTNLSAPRGVSGYSCDFRFGLSCLPFCSHNWAVLGVRQRELGARRKQSPELSWALVLGSTVWRYRKREGNEQQSSHCRKYPYYVMSLGRDCLDAVRIPDNQISIRAHCNTALPRVQVEDFSCVCAGHSHKLILIHLASHLRKDKRVTALARWGILQTAKSWQHSRFKMISTGAKTSSGTTITSVWEGMIIQCCSSFSSECLVAA